jgi:hypothetical protein
MTTDWMTNRRTVDVRCAVDIEQTHDSFHAHAVPDGIDIQPGDVVLVHGAPTEIGFGDHIVCECRATVARANWFTRTWTQFAGLFELTELYEVGFMPRDTP